MREHVDTDIASAHLVINGNSVILAQDDELIDVLAKGQGVLNVLSLASVKHEVDDPAGPARGRATGPVGQRLARPRPPAKRRPVARRLTARRGAPHARRPDGAVRRLGDAARVHRHDRRAHGLSPRRRRSSTCRIWARCASPGRTPSSVCSARSPTTSPRSRPGGPSTRTCSTMPTARCSTTSSSGGIPSGRRRAGVRRDAERVQHRPRDRRARR